MAEHPSLSHAGVVGAVLLITAAAGYGLVRVDERLGMLHLTRGEILALRGGASGQIQPGATPSPQSELAQNDAGPNGVDQSASGQGEAESSEPANDQTPQIPTATVQTAHTQTARNETGQYPNGLIAQSAQYTSRKSRAPLYADEPGSDRFGTSAPHTKDIAIATAVTTTASPAPFNYIAPPAYLAGLATATPSDAPTDRRYVVRRILPITGPIRYGEWHWDEAGVPPGPLVITVDLEARVISAFRSGYEIGTAAVLLGTQAYPTPTGMFPVSQKDARHVSNIYDAPMPYMLRLTRDGVSIHGSNVRNGFASHGCIGVPMGFAKVLYDHVQLGDRVYITRGKQVGLGDALVDR